MRTGYLIYNKNSYFDNDGDSPEVEWGNRDTEHITWSPLYLKTQEPSGDMHISYDRVDLPDEIKQHYYVVAVRYSDGDTFGHTTGYHDIVSIVSSQDEAQAICDGIKNKTYKTSTKYCPWDGYFSSLEGVEMHLLDIRD